MNWKEESGFKPTFHDRADWREYALPIQRANLKRIGSKRYERPSSERLRLARAEGWRWSTFCEFRRLLDRLDDARATRKVKSCLELSKRYDESGFALESEQTNGKRLAERPKDAAG